MTEAALFIGESSYSSKIADAKQFPSLSKERIEILRLVAKQPMYPAEIARELGMPEQTAYYHMRALVSANLVELAGTEHKQGGTAKKYSFPAESLSLLLSQRGAHGLRVQRTGNPPPFLSPFIKSGVFDGAYVVGSPDPHGPFRSRGSEFCIAEMAMFAGAFCSFDYPLYYLDTELTDALKKRNIIALGGPKVNTFVNEVNSSLLIHFERGSFAVYSSLSRKKYSEDVGVVASVANPFHNSSRLLVVAGNSHHGTRVGVLGLLRHAKALEKGNFYDSSVVAKVFAGFDEDADGIVDAVEILE